MASDQQRDHLFSVVQYAIDIHEPVNETRRAATSALRLIEEQLEALAENRRGAHSALDEAGVPATDDGSPIEDIGTRIAMLVEQYAELATAAREVVGSPFGSIDQRAFYRLREVLGD